MRDSAAALMQSEPSLVRRPVLVMGEVLAVGFDEACCAPLSGWLAVDEPAA